MSEGHSLRGLHPNTTGDHDMETNRTVTPPLTVVEGGSPVQQFKIAREKMGLSVSDVCSRLKMTPRQVNAIEAGSLDGLPPGAYAKAFVKSYAKLLELDADLMAAALFAGKDLDQKTDFPLTGRIDRRPPQSEVSISMASEKTVSSQGKGLGSYSVHKNSDKRVVIASVAVLLVGVSVYFLGPIAQDKWKASHEQPVLTTSPAMEPAPEVAAPVVDPNASSVTLNPQITAPAADPPNPASGSTPPASPPPAAPVAAVTPPPAVATPVAVAPAPAAAAVTAAPVAPAASAKPSAVTAPVAAPAPAQVAPAASAGPAPAIKLVFSDRAWVTVRDRDGNVLMSQLNAPGTEKTLEGKGPFKLILGNAPAVKLTHRGKDVDLKPYIRDDVARMTLD